MSTTVEKQNDDHKQVRRLRNSKTLQKLRDRQRRGGRFPEGAAAEGAAAEGAPAVAPAGEAGPSAEV